MQYRIIVIMIFSTILIGCMDGESKEKETDYEATKKIVVDILQTEDGRKAIQEAIHDEEMKKELVIQSDIVKQSINELLNSTDGAKVWAEFFNDTTFAESFIKSTEESQMELYKKLMYDPDFQKQMLALLQNPEITNQIMTTMKSQQFREHLAETIEQIINSPLFLAEMEKVLLKAVEEEKKEAESSEKEKEESKEEEENL